MCLEAIYAWKEQSRLGRPLERFDNWAEVENDFNVKHAYQVGADAIWWFIGQLVGGNTHDPASVFQGTWDAFNRGENPVLCIAQNYDFSGAPHCILPVGWNRNVTPWQLEVFDPNFPNQRRILTVDPATNCFRYDGLDDGSRLYTGDAWSGGRMHYMPWCVVNHRQRTPVWDAILLLLGGVVVLFADTAEVSGLKDENGRSLDAASATDRSGLGGKLLKVSGLSGLAPVKGSFYVGRSDRQALMLRPELVQAIELSTSALTGLVPGVRRPRPARTLRAGLAVPPAVRIPVGPAPTAGTLSGPAMMVSGPQRPRHVPAPHLAFRP